jgi:hypothetical protein
MCKALVEMVKRIILFITLILLSVIFFPKLLIAENLNCPTPNDFPNYCGAHNQGCCGETGSYSCCSNYICMEGYNCHCRDAEVPGWDCSLADGIYITTTTIGGTTTTTSGSTTTTTEDYGHDCANYHDDCYNCLEHDMSGPGSCGYCVDKQKCIQGASDGPWHVYTIEECGTWIWDSGDDCTSTPPEECSKGSCVSMGGQWISGECRVERCSCRNCGSSGECCNVWGGCDPVDNYREDTENYVYRVDKSLSQEECGEHDTNPCGNGDLDPGEVCDYKKDCGGIVPLGDTRGCILRCADTNGYYEICYKDCSGYSIEDNAGNIWCSDDCGSDLSCDLKKEGGECVVNGNYGTCENCECIPNIQSSGSNPRPNIPIEQSFHGESFNQGGIAIITGPLETVIRSISSGSIVIVTPESSGQLVTRAISLNPEARITRLIQEIQEV